MRSEPTRYEEQIRKIADAIRNGDSQITLNHYSSEARKLRDKLGIPISPNVEELPIDVRKHEHLYILDISKVKKISDI